MGSRGMYWLIGAKIACRGALLLVLSAWLSSGEGRWATLTALGALALVSVGYFVILSVARGVREVRIERERKT